MSKVRDERESFRWRDNWDSGRPRPTVRQVGVDGTPIHSLSRSDAGTVSPVPKTGPSKSGSSASDDVGFEGREWSSTLDDVVSFCQGRPSRSCGSTMTPSKVSQRILFTPYADSSIKGVFGLKVDCVHLILERLEHPHAKCGCRPGRNRSLT